MTGLLDLPSELIASIFHFLDDTEIFSTRLTNKYIENASLSYFGRRFFRKKGYLITTPSINVLQSIAAHLELRKYVQHVWFNPDFYTFTTPNCGRQLVKEEANETGLVSMNFYHFSEEERRQYQAYLDSVSDHSQLLLNGGLDEKLITAFKNLPNLVVIGMRRSEDHSPWGWSRLRDAIGEDPRVLGSTNAYNRPISRLSAPTKLFMAIVNSVAAANVELKRLYTDAVEIDHILPDQLSQDLLNTAFRSLLYLEINTLHAQFKLEDEQKIDFTPCKNQSEYGEGLLRLVKAVPHLRELGLQIFPSLKQNHRAFPLTSRDLQIFRMGYSYLTFKKIVQNSQLSNLTRLKLEKNHIYTRALQSLPDAIPSLSTEHQDPRYTPPLIDGK